MKLSKSKIAYGSEEFEDTLKKEIQTLSPEQLPLQKGLSISSYVGPSPFTVTILKVSEDADNIIIKTGVFYTGIIAGCNCSDDPSPVDEQNEYCEILFTINKNTAETSVNLFKE